MPELPFQIINFEAEKEVVKAHPEDFGRQGFLHGGFEVDTHISEASPLSALYCYNCCGYIIDQHEFKAKIAKEKATEAEIKNSYRIAASIGAKLGVEGAGASADMSKTITETITSKIDAKLSVEIEYEIKSGVTGTHIQHAAKCQKIWTPIGIITRADIKGKVKWSLPYAIHRSNTGPNHSVELIASFGEPSIDVGGLHITSSIYIGPYGDSPKITKNDCEQCRDGCGSEFFTEEGTGESVAPNKGGDLHTGKD